MTLTVHPLTPDRWGDLERLFGPNGASSGCWCMWNRQSSREFDEHHGADNHAALARIVADGPPPGLLAYDGDEPVGWVAVGPREDYGRLLRSPVAKPADATPSWIVHCFVVGRSHRGRGVAQRLLEEAVAFAADRGAAAVEGCPIDSPQDRIDTGSAWHGLASMFTRAGFVEIARRSPTRPLMRKVLAAGQ